MCVCVYALASTIFCYAIRHMYMVDFGLSAINNTTALGFIRDYQLLDSPSSYSPFLYFSPLLFMLPFPTYKIKLYIHNLVI